MYQGVSSYLINAFDSTDKIIEKALKSLAGVDYDTMVGTGLSGAMVVPLLARALNKKFAIVRKPGDSSHRERAVEGSVGDRWIFVDDFVCSGSTVKRVQGEIATIQQGQLYNWEKFTTLYVGTYQYARNYRNYVPDGAHF